MCIVALTRLSDFGRRYGSIAAWKRQGHDDVRHACVVSSHCRARVWSEDGRERPASSRGVKTASTGFRLRSGYRESHLGRVLHGPPHRGEDDIIYRTNTKLQNPLHQTYICVYPPCEGVVGARQDDFWGTVCCVTSQRPGQRKSKLQAYSGVYEADMMNDVCPEEMPLSACHGPRK
jgi:hypothetical protein